MTDPRTITRFDLDHANLDEVGIYCTTCGVQKYPREFVTHNDICERCVEDDLRSEQEKAFQNALNDMPADFILTFNIVVSIYYEGLADKKNPGEVVELLCYFAKEAVKEKSKQLHQ